MMTESKTAPAAEPDIYDAKNFVPGRCIGPLIGRVRVELIEALDRALEPLNVTAAQFVVISTLASGAESASQICRGISYDAGAMTRMIDLTGVSPESVHAVEALVARIRAEGEAPPPRPA